MSNGIFGSVFDFNGDGDLAAFEQAAEFMFLQKLTEDGDTDENNDDDEARA